ncbi:MAG TPA: hypothetical protein PLR25_12730 [Planctomycetaceae bacterium]|nr:hypothetical protein [Planctomycetaceae bacterium]
MRISLKTAQNDSEVQVCSGGTALIDGEWVGENWLGELWMELRAELIGGLEAPATSSLQMTTDKKLVTLTF